MAETSKRHSYRIAESTYTRWDEFARATGRTVLGLITVAVEAEISRHIARLRKKAPEIDTDERVRQIIQEEVARLVAGFPRAGETNNEGGPRLTLVQNEG